MRIAALIAIVALGSLPAPAEAARLPARPSLVALPEEPGARVLTDAPTVQAVVADLDEDGAREVVALTVTDDGSVGVTAWTESAGAWTALGPPLGLPPAGSQPGPVRLLVRDVGDRERVTLARQPLVPGASSGEPCCLHLEDVTFDGGRLVLAPVAEPMDAVDALFAADLDGDGSDELVGTRSLPPLGDVSFPTAISILRWDGRAFASQTVVELPVGSGDTPFLLGDTDGLPGEELAIIATRGRSEVHRIAMAPADGGLRVDDAGIAPTPVDVAGIRVAGGAGIALLSDEGVLEARPWPAGRAIGEPLGRTQTRSAGVLLGDLDVGEESFVAVLEVFGVDALDLRQLPLLAAAPLAVPPVRPAALAYARAPARPYAGPLPGGGPNGGDAVLVAGRMVGGGSSSIGIDGQVALLAGAAPVGLAGTDRSWLAIHQVPAGVPDPSGGRLDLVQAVPGSGLTIAPLATVAARAEADDGSFDPTFAGGRPTAAGGLEVGPAGARIHVEAPAGTRVHVAGLDPAASAAIHVVGPAGSAEVALVPPASGVADRRLTAALTVTTPAGHSYVAGWDVTVVTDPPTLETEAITPLGSGSAIVRGTTVAGSTVTVAGRPVVVDADGRFAGSVAVPPWPTDVVVTATGPFGTRAERVVSAVGLFDYRALPWIGIAGAALGGVALLLALRTPSGASPPRRGDDAVLVELDED